MIYIGAPKTALTSPTSTLGRAGPSSPLIGTGFIDAPDTGKTGVKEEEEEEEEEEERRRKRLSMGKFKQEGGILGRLGFEETDTSNARLAGEEVEVIQVQPADQDVPASAVEQYETLLPAPEEPEGRASEEMELLGSADRKSRFWQGKGRARRSSKAASDFEDDARVSRSIQSLPIVRD